MALPTPDNLTVLNDVKAALSITDGSEDSLITLLIPTISAVITESLGRTFLLGVNAANPITEVYRGSGYPELKRLRHWPVQTAWYTGTITANSTTITGLSSTKFLWIGQPVSDSLASLPLGTTVTAIDSTAKTVTVSLTPTITGSATLSFGVAVWLDSAAYGGSAPGAFGTSTQLNWGADFYIDQDQPDGSSRSAILTRINDFWTPNVYRGNMQLSEYTAPGPGNVKVQYCGGFSTLPPDLELACIRAIAKCRNSKWYGDLVSNESFLDSSYSLQQHAGQIRLGLLDGDVAPILARYRYLDQGY